MKVSDKIRDRLEKAGKRYWAGDNISDVIGAKELEDLIDEAELKEGQTRLLSVDNPLVVPADTRIKLLVTGNDVMHSFFVPSLAVQVYAFIGRTNEVWIDVPAGKQTYYGQCNQICGVNHAYMPIEVVALPRAEYDAWLSSAREEFAMNDDDATPSTIVVASAQ